MTWSLRLRVRSDKARKIAFQSQALQAAVFKTASFISTASSFQTLHQVALRDEIICVHSLPSLWMARRSTNTAKISLPNS